jgi:predicted RNA-binding protein with PIN domain
MPPGKRIIVDGANVMHAWPDLRPLLARRRQVARERLVDRLQVLHDSGLAEVRVVFDGRGPEPVVESRAGELPLLVVYTASGQTADEVIEQLVAQAKTPADITVATADRLERQTVEAAGGQVISPADLAGWISRAEGRQAAKLSDQRRENEARWRP